MRNPRRARRAKGVVVATIPALGYGDMLGLEREEADGWIALARRCRVGSMELSAYPGKAIRHR